MPLSTPLERTNARWAANASVARQQATASGARAKMDLRFMSVLPLLASDGSDRARRCRAVVSDEVVAVAFQHRPRVEHSYGVAHHDRIADRHLGIDERAGVDPVEVAGRGRLADAQARSAGGGRGGSEAVGAIVGGIAVRDGRDGRHIPAVLDAEARPRIAA